MRRVAISLLGLLILLTVLISALTWLGVPVPWQKQAFATHAFIVPTSAKIATTAPAPTSAPPLTADPTPTSLVPPTWFLEPDALHVHFIDVGQGDSILIQTPDGRNALIDGGPTTSGLLTYLRAQRITRIDALIVSHPHADHIGELIGVLKTLSVGGVWTSGAAHSTGTFEQFIDAIASAKVPYYEVKRGDSIPLGSLALTVLYSNSKARNLNDKSLVLRLVYGNVSFLFTGDMEKPSETDLLRDRTVSLASTILKVAHHGSATSSTPEFLAAVAPQVAIYSAGRQNSYGHPHPQTIRNLCAAKITIYGTALHGTIMVSTKGNQYTIQTTINAPPHGCER